MFSCIIMSVIYVLVFVSLLQLCCGHVSLTYPPGRDYNLDFLDNQRTKKPCGMPRGKWKTTIRAGEKINITWDLAYPHMGGFKLSVLDGKYNPVKVLTPYRKNEKHPFFQDSDATAQNFEYRFPADFECRGCSIQLIRQALEWSAKGGYYFWSCADVDIITGASKQCSGQGAVKDGVCKCERLYTGEECQYREECEDNSDCGGDSQGKCVHVTPLYTQRNSATANQGGLVINVPKNPR